MILRKWRFLYPLLILCGALVSQAHAVPIVEQIVNGGFGDNTTPSLASWTVLKTTLGGDGVNARPSTNTINSSTGSSGFNSHFSSAFAVLGDVSGIIGDAPTAGTNMIFQSFVLPALQGTRMVDSYDLLIDFRTAFDGPGMGSGTDLFSVLLSLPDHSDIFLVFEPSAASVTQRNNDFTDFLVSVPCLGPGTCDGTYTLKFQLSENSATTTNTAAGIDQVSITGEANLVPLPEPSTILLLASGLLVALPLVKRGRVRRFFKY